MSQSSHDPKGKRPAESSSVRLPIRLPILQEDSSYYSYGAPFPSWPRVTTYKEEFDWDQPLALLRHETGQDWTHYRDHVFEMLILRGVPETLAPMPYSTDRVLAAAIATLDEERRVNECLVSDIEQLTLENREMKEARKKSDSQVEFLTNGLFEMQEAINALRFEAHQDRLRIGALEAQLEPVEEAPAEDLNVEVGQDQDEDNDAASDISMENGGD